MTEVKVEILGRKPPRPRFKWLRKTRIKQAQPRMGAAFRIAKAAWWIVKPRRASWALASIVAVVVVFGTPHMLLTYQCLWRGTPGQRCTACSYIGVQGMRGYVGRDGNCPLIMLLPVDWAALQKQFLTQ